MAGQTSAADFLGCGWAFPIAFTGGRLASRADEDQIRQSILLILQTPKGARVMEPEFGSDLQTMVFEAGNEGAVHVAAYAVRTALETWEARIKVLDVAARIDPEQPERLLIDVSYLIRSFNSRHNLVFPFYLG